MERYKVTALISKSKYGRMYAAVDTQEGIEVTIMVVSEDSADQSIAAHSVLKNTPEVLLMKDSFAIQTRVGTQKVVVHESIRKSTVSSVTNTLGSTMMEASAATFCSDCLLPRRCACSRYYPQQNTRIVVIYQYGRRC